MQLHEMSVCERDVIVRLVEGPPWTTYEDLADRLGYKAVEREKLIPKGRGLERIAQAVEGLSRDGWLAVQADDQVTLSKEGAKRLGLRLSLKGKAPRWVRTSKQLPAEVESWLPEDRQRRRPASRSAEQLDQVEASTREWFADEDELEVHERYYRTGPHWIWLWTYETCELCRGRQVPKGQHCLCCGRSG